MNLFQQTKQLCQDYDIKPARSRGQNFLIQESIYQKIIKASDLCKSDTVLEVGPGLGFLTIELAKKVKQVIAVEIDKKLVEVLQNRLQEEGIKNVEVINMDILEVSNSKFQIPKKSQTLNLKSKNYKIVANLPYNISSRFIRKFLAEADSKPKLMVLMLQAEVAERLIAKPGQMSLLSVSAQMYADIEKIAKVSAGCFWPKPKVESSIIKLRIKNYELQINETKFFKLVRAGFSAKRKQLQNNLAKILKIDKEKIEKILIENNLPPKVRAQELSPNNWQNIYLDILKK